MTGRIVFVNREYSVPRHPVSEGRKLDVMILAPTEVRGGDTVLAGVITKPTTSHELSLRSSSRKPI